MLQQGLYDMEVEKRDTLLAMGLRDSWASRKFWKSERKMIWHSPPPRLVGRYFYLFVFLTPKKRRPTSPVATIPPTFQGRGSPKLSPFVALSVISEGGFRHVAASSPRKGAWCYMWLLGMMDTPTLCPKGPGRADKCSFEQNNKSRPQIPEGDVLSQRLSAPQALKCLRGGAETSLLHWVSPGKLGTIRKISIVKTSILLKAI